MLLLNPLLTKWDFIYPWISAAAWAVAHRLTSKYVLLPMASSYKLNKVDKIKFEVSSWKFICFTASSVVGIYVLSVMPWTFTPEAYLRYWPNHPFTTLEQAYYIFCFGNVAYSSISLLVEPKQKDFPAMIVHHITTIALMVFSYLVQMQRIGCIVLLVHDVSDPIMEAAKCSLYLGKTILANVCFVVFMVVFMVTRLALYPYLVIYTFLKYGFHEDGQRYPEGNYQLFHTVMILLYILQVLHIYWAYLIVQLAVKVLTEKELKGDIRDKDE